MSPRAKEVKQSVFLQASPAKDQLIAVYRELQKIPRTMVARRQLGVIISNLNTWQQRYMPEASIPTWETMEFDAGLDQADKNRFPYTRAEIDLMLKKYREVGYLGMDSEEKKILAWYDEHYVSGPENGNGKH
ncbi:hypothetical protein BcepF1.010 [Burkholderia phage BcepF1]|uniref:Uncharacterized protein n=1 Tax=Burkholderia phage BcepF1 TaxID=2886897 RepID=A1YZR4_9CAUD|nr:hypothetical protein BcepF1.010 [Burkholderia phage BcepF1]ABL96741.1 hypothetical protein BcepF1.010 [Burkholderia phage BcepF1]